MNKFENALTFCHNNVFLYLLPIHMHITIHTLSYRAVLVKMWKLQSQEIKLYTSFHNCEAMESYSILEIIINSTTMFSLCVALFHKIDDFDIPNTL